MMKNEDLTKLSKTELRQKIKNLKEKENKRGDIGKLTAMFSLCFGALSAIALREFMIPCAVCVASAALGVITGWGFYASSINCSTKRDEMEKELNSRPEEDYTQLAMDTLLKEAVVKKSGKKKAVKASKEHNDENNLTL